MADAIGPRATALLCTEALGLPTTVVDLLVTTRAATTEGHRAITGMVITDTVAAVTTDTVVVIAAAMAFPLGSSHRPLEDCKVEKLPTTFPGG